MSKKPKNNPTGAGRPRLDDEALVRTSIMLAPRVIEIVEEIAAARSVSKGTVIREAIDLGLGRAAGR